MVEITRLSPGESVGVQGGSFPQPLGAPASSRQGGEGTKSPLEQTSMRGLKPTSRLEAGAPSAIVVVGTRYASPTSRLEAGAPSAIY